jgi:hypothetical protein
MSCPPAVHRFLCWLVIAGCPLLGAGCEQSDEGGHEIEPLQAPAGQAATDTAAKTTEPGRAAAGEQPAPGEPNEAASAEPDERADDEPVPEGAVRLRWKLPKGQELVGFKARIADIPLGSDPFGRLDGAKIIEAEGLDGGSAARLRKLTPVRRSGLTAVLAAEYGDNLKVRVVKDDFELPADLEPAVAMRVRQREGLAHRGTIDDDGRVLSAAAGDDYRLLGLLFGLPAEPVAEGSEWESGLELLRTGGLEVEQEKRFDRMRLVQLAAGGDVAVIQGCIAEIQRGQHFTAEGVEQVERKAVFVGRGRFDVAAGRWQSFAGRLKIDDPLADQPQRLQVLELVHLDRVPQQVRAFIR